MHREQAGAKGLGFSVVIEPGLPHRYRGDRGAIRGHAHDLAGSSSMIGAHDLATVLRESEGDDGSLDLAAWLSRVETAHATAHAIRSEKCGSTA